MGSRGPIPKRDDERRRQNKPDAPTDTIEVEGPVEIPPANRRWHQIAKQIYESLESSGQSKFYEPSDWAAAYMLAESLSRDLKPQVLGISEVKGVDECGQPFVRPKVVKAYMPLKGTSLSAYLKAFAALGVAEGDRRRIGIEIDRKPEKPDLVPVSVMDEYRAALGG